MTNINLDSKSTNIIIAGGFICSIVLVSCSSLYVAYKYGYNCANSANLANTDNLANSANNVDKSSAPEQNIPSIIRKNYLIGLSEGYNYGFSTGFNLANKDKQISNSTNEDMHPLLYYYDIITNK